MGRRFAVRATALALLAARAVGQGTPFACCYAGTKMQYGMCGAPLPGVVSWTDFVACWRQASLHFANTTVVGEYNLTMAEKYNVFTVILADNEAHGITADPADLPLAFDADVIAPGARPELGYLPFELRIGLPSSGSGAPGGCLPFELRGLGVNLTLHHQAPRSPGRPYAGFTFGIAGCGRKAQTVSNFQFHALGYGNLEFYFVTLRDSHDILSIEPPSDVPRAGDAVNFQECDVARCTIRYFGDVTGDLGNTYGLSQNGSRATDVVFRVEDPAPHVPAYGFRPDGDGYTFAWYGSYPQEWGSQERDFVHLERSRVEFIRDVQLGSANISACNITPWLSARNPVFAAAGANSTGNPPSIELYNMESGVSEYTNARGERTRWIDRTSSQSGRAPCARRWLRTPSGAAVPGGSRSKGASSVQGAGPARTAPRPRFGCNASDSYFLYAWDVDVRESAVARSRFFWAAGELVASQGVVPAPWLHARPNNPSFYLNLQTSAPDAGFLWEVNDTLACMRPSLKLANGTAVEAQALTKENGSITFRSLFTHTGDPKCAARARPADAVWYV